MKGCICLLAFFAICLFAGMVSAGTINLNDSFDLGDINGGYNTTNPNANSQYANLAANVGGQHKIDNASISIYPDYWYTYDDKGNFVSRTVHGYVVNASFFGEITSTLNDWDIGYQNQSNRFNARGIDFSQNSYSDVYKDYYSYTGSGDGDKYTLFSQAGVSMSILNFNVQSAYGNYNEWTWNGGGGMGAGIVPDAGGPIGDSITDFNYSVNWYGDFLPGTTPSGFVAPAMVTNVGQAVPEPSTWAMLLSAALGGILMIHRRFA